jgi:hypothetical protein
MQAMAAQQQQPAGPPQAGNQEAVMRALQ